ncbi:MAG TPA: hypothetical protein VNM24_07545 [Burkholderiales bacterium]|jgi:hypothetical protein|nr:hypothetical protein [Burkholderiales bacterium]
MPIEALAKPVIDALMRALGQAREARLRRNARRALSEAISELILANPDVDKARAKIAVAKAAGIIDGELFTAERMLKKVKKANKRKRRATGKAPAARMRKRRAPRARKGSQRTRRR